MAESDETEDQRRARRARLMSPHPPRPFQPYKGPPVREGHLIASISVCQLLWVESLRFLLQVAQRNDEMVFRVDCAFDPYSETRLTQSHDIQILEPPSTLVSLNNAPLVYMSRLSIAGGVFLDIPYRRSNKSTSTAFCSDGSRIAWPGYTNFNVLDFCSGLKVVLDSPKTLCGAFSADGALLALLSANDDLVHLRIVDSKTFSIVAKGFYFPEFIPPTRPPLTTYADNPVHLLWSKCGRYIGMSTYYRELVVFRVKFLIDIMETNPFFVPKLRRHGDFYQISHPKAFDFATRMFGGHLNQVITIIAIGTVANSVRLYEIQGDKLGTMIGQTDVLDDQPAGTEFVINCVRFSNAFDFLAIALSNSVIVLLDNVSLSPIKRLRVNHLTTPPSIHMPLYRGFSSLCFACSDNFLAAGATDGVLRIWCLRRPVGPLLALCRTVIRSHCKMDDMPELPLPPPIQKYLTDTAF